MRKHDVDDDVALAADEAEHVPAAVVYADVGPLMQARHYTLHHEEPYWDVVHA